MNVYGPVKSRRLGNSLGISIVPNKVCSFDCIYCELEPTANPVNRVDSYIGADEIMRELDSFLINNSREIDVFTITGFGEPTINKNINLIAKAIKEKYRYPLVLLTNSSFLDSPSVVDSFKYFDKIVPSLDAVSEDLFKKIDRPEDSISAKKMVENVIFLRSKYDGEIELEIAFCEGVNDTTNEIGLLYEAAKKIMPNKVFINSVARKPAYSYAKPISQELIDSLNTLFYGVTLLIKYRDNKLDQKFLLDELKKGAIGLDIIRDITALPLEEEDLMKHHRSVKKIEVLNKILYKV